MPIKNSLKIFASKFSMVYSILLYLVIATVVLASVSAYSRLSFSRSGGSYRKSGRRDY